MSGRDPDGPAYRPRAAGGMDAGTKRLALIASGIGLFLLVVVGGWSLGGGHGAGGAGAIPVFGPDPGPIKVKPVNPGGLQLTGAEPPPANDDNGAGPSLAPGPEKPDPAALQAELDAARRAEAPAAGGPSVAATPLAGAAAAAVATHTAAGPDATHIAAGTAASLAADRAQTAIAATGAQARPTANSEATPATGKAETTTHAAALPTASPGSLVASPPNAAVSSEAAATPASEQKPGGIAVQLAAVDTEAAAQAQWSRLTRAHPDLLDGRTPLVLSATRGEKTFYRLRTGGFPTVAAAGTFCAHLRAAGAACTIATF